jgi:hypothetical protein
MAFRPALTAHWEEAGSHAHRTFDDPEEFDQAMAMSVH